MSFACDLILIAVALFTLYNGWTKGFIKSVMGLVKGFAAAIAAYAYTPMLSPILNEKWIGKPLADGIFETLRSLALDTSTDLYNLDRLAIDLPAPLVSMLERYNVNIADFSSGIKGLEQVTEDVVYTTASKIAESTAALLSSALAFILIFLGVFLVLSVLTALLDLIFRMPVLNTANKFLGIIFGAAEALLLLSVVSVLLSALVTSLGSLEPTLFGADVIEHSVVCKFFAEHSPINQLYHSFE